MKSGLHKQFKTDKKAEKDGIAVRFDPNDDKTVPTFYVARMGGANETEWLKARARVWAPHREAEVLQTLSEDTKYQLARQSFVEGCLRGWENVQDEDGNPIPYSAPAAVKLFEELPDVFVELQNRALSLSAYLVVNVEASAKN